MKTDTQTAMLRNFLSNIFYDPRKILLCGCVAALLVAATGFMDYRYNYYQYALLFLFVVLPLPLFFLGRLRLHVRAEIPNAIGWVMVAVVMAVIGYNIYAFGLPFLVIKAIEGIDLDAAQGEYYHHLLKLTALWIPLLTVMMPLTLCVRDRLLKWLLFGLPVFASVVIQIRQPFLFGLIYFLTLYQILGKHISAKLLTTTILLFLAVFLVIGVTRTEESLIEIADTLGVSRDWTWVSAVVWFPLSYLGGAVTNALHTMSYDLLSFDLRNFLNLLPDMILPQEQKDYLLMVSIPELPWPANNAVAAWGSLSHMFGVFGLSVGMFVLTLFLVLLPRTPAILNPLMLAFFLVCLKNFMLFPLGNYFLYPTTTFEFLILAGCLMCGRIQPPVDDIRRAAQLKSGG